jgi:hypothetical protein
MVGVIGLKNKEDELSQKITKLIELEKEKN